MWKGAIAAGGMKRKSDAFNPSVPKASATQKRYHGSIASSLLGNTPKAKGIMPAKPKAWPQKPTPVRSWGSGISAQPSQSSSSSSSPFQANAGKGKIASKLQSSASNIKAGATIKKWAGSARTFPLKQSKKQQGANEWEQMEQMWQNTFEAIQGWNANGSSSNKKKRNRMGAIASGLEAIWKGSSGSSGSSSKTKFGKWGKSKWNPDKALKEELEQMLKHQKLPEVLAKAKSKLNSSDKVKDFLPRILELAAKKGGAAQYSEALSFLVQKRLPIDVVMFTKLLVLLTSRVPAPTAMVRLTLNLAIPKDGQVVPLIPEGATEEEERAVFEDGEPLDTNGKAREAPPPTTPAKEMPPQPAVKDAADVQAAREALSRVQPALLRGLVQVSDKAIGAYFGHFVSLLHLEFIEELKALKRRMQRDYENLERFGWATSGLQVRHINVTQLSHKSGKGNLPGRESSKKTRLVFNVSPTMDLERLRMRPGDSVLLSRSDPLKDYHAEGIVDSAPTAAEDGLGLDLEERRKPLIVTVEGELAGKPEQVQEGTWRLDKAANRTAYERQFQALLRFAKEKADKRLPVWGVLPVTGVGGGNVDAWADKMRKMLDEKQQASLEAGGSESTAASTRSSSGGPSALETVLANKLRRIAAEDPDSWNKQKLFAARQEIKREKSGLNESQIKAVCSALGQRCTLIQGPPGTGKTHVSVRLLQTWAQKFNNVRPLLATSDSNIAVDNIAEGLQQKGVTVVRLGRPEKVTSNLEDMTLESKLRKHNEEKRKEEEDKEEKAAESSNAEKPGKGKGVGKKGGKKGSKFDGKGKKGSKDALSAEEAKQKRVEDYEAKLAILQQADVICTTTIAAGTGFLHAMKFGAILIDEVAQATELSAIVPLILRGAPRFVLVGDHCQLPPSVNSLEAETRGLSLSLFGRLAAQGLEPCFLDTQYRMHPAIADFSCQEFYHGKLKTGIPASARPPPQGFAWPQESGIAFINVDGWESRDGESRSNEQETRQLAQVLAKILAEQELSVLEVGIVSPYSAQVRLLRQVLRRELPHILRGTGVDLTGGLEGKRGARALEIASVDAFQGREKELIIFSAVRSNRHGAVGFLADWRRLNVMITRARRGLIVLGNFDTLRHDPTWEKWLNWATENGLVIEGRRQSSPLETGFSDRRTSRSDNSYWHTDGGAAGVAGHSHETSWSSANSSTSPSGWESSDAAGSSASGMSWSSGAHYESWDSGAPPMEVLDLRSSSSDTNWSSSGNVDSWASSDGESASGDYGSQSWTSPAATDLANVLSSAGWDAAGSTATRASPYGNGSSAGWASAGSAATRASPYGRTATGSSAGWAPAGSAATRASPYGSTAMGQGRPSMSARSTAAHSAPSGLSAEQQMNWNFQQLMNSLNQR